MNKDQQMQFTTSSSHAQSSSSNETVSIKVDIRKKISQIKPIWTWFGYDEPNYTYMKDGQKLLSELASANPTPVTIRVHNLLTSGDGRPALKWGSTNAYTEAPNGNPIYNWTIIDQIFDSYVERGMKPLVEIGFMPEDLSIEPHPYQHAWRPGAPYEQVYTGWAYPPKNYEQWAELVYRWVQHSVNRYGEEEVETWYWELWNEPNIGYWQGSIEEYLKLYDYTVEAVKNALPTAKIGGPHVTGPSWNVSEKFLRAFLEHCIQGKNYCTGKTGAPLDYIGFHAKGKPEIIAGHVRMDMGQQLRDISRGFEIVASYPELKHLPIIIGESDPEGCAACSMKEYPENAYRNGTMYSSYTAASFPRKLDLANHFGVNLKGAVTWAFEFEDQPWFYGFRDLATNGVDKPVLNIFRMFGMMSGDRVDVQGDFAYDFLTVRDDSVRGRNPDINAFAVRSEKSVSVMIWHYHDDDILGPSAPVALTLTGLPDKRVMLNHYRVDHEHSNAYEVWKKIGAPQNPTSKQYAVLERAGQLALFTSPQWVNPSDGCVSHKFELPRQGVSLVVLDF